MSALISDGDAVLGQVGAGERALITPEGARAANGGANRAAALSRSSDAGGAMGADGGEWRRSVHPRSGRSRPRRGGAEGGTRWTEESAVVVVCLHACLVCKCTGVFVMTQKNWKFSFTCKSVRQGDVFLGKGLKKIFLNFVLPRTYHQQALDYFFVLVNIDTGTRIMTYTPTYLNMK